MASTPKPETGATVPTSRIPFGRQQAGKILVFAMILISLLFVVSLGHFLLYVWPGTSLVIDSQTYVFLFLLLLSVALFLSVLVGERSSLTIAGITFAGSAGILAALLAVFVHFSEKIGGRSPPEFAYLMFNCDQQQIDQKDLVIKAEGKEGYFKFLDKKLNGSAKAQAKRFLRPHEHNHPSLRNKSIITKPRSEDGFRVPIGFKYDHKLTILPVDRNAADTAAPSKSGSRGQPLMVVRIPKISRENNPMMIDVTFDLNVAAYVCKRPPKKETAVKSAGMEVE